MPKSIAGALLLSVVFFGLLWLTWSQTSAVPGLQAQLEIVNTEAAELRLRVDDLAERLDSGHPAGPSSRRPPETTPAPPGAEALRRYYRHDEWAALLAPGNLIEPRGAPYRTAHTRSDGVLTRALAADVPSLNRIVTQSANIHEIHSYVNRALARRSRDDPNRWIGELAYRVEANDDLTEYHVWLRRDAKWHPPAVDLADPRYTWLSGEHHVRADDFAFALELVQNPAVAADHLRGSLRDLTGVEVVDDHHFIVRWANTFQGSLEVTLELEPVPRWLFGHDEDGRAFTPDELGARFNEHWYNDRAIGCGPYRFVRWEPGRVIELARWDEYFDEPPPIERIVFRVLSDPNARLNELLAGGIDYTVLLPSQYEQAILQQGQPAFANGTLQHESFQGMSFRMIAWNADRPLFADRRVRLAMTHAFDRQRLLDEVFHGLGRLVIGPFFIDGPYYNHDLAPYPFDLERAADLLTQAGWVDADHNGVRERVVDGRPLTFELDMLTYAERPEFLAAMEIYRNDLATIGVRLNVDAQAWPVMVERMSNRDFDAFTGGWSGSWDLDPYRLFHSSQADLPSGSNRVGFRNAEADAIIEAARRTLDMAERARLFGRLQEILHAEQPMTFFYSERVVAAWRSRVQNVEFSPMFPSDLSFSWYLSD